MELDQSMDSLPNEWLSIRDDSAVDELGLWDSKMLQSFDESSHRLLIVCKKFNPILNLIR